MKLLLWELITTFDLGSTIEFTRWALGFGRHARVLGSRGLADDIRAELRDALDAY